MAIKTIMCVVGVKIGDDDLRSAIKIEVKPPPTALDIKKRIEDALKRAAEVEAKSIAVDVDGFGKVKLEGNMNAWSERNAVERAAWSAPGVTMVDDCIIVV